MEVAEDNQVLPNEDHLKILKDHFRIDNFKAEQWKAISQLMYKKEDVFITASSGYGKSLIYQFPPVFLGKKSIVISPLISLMETQVQKLESQGISACFISGQQKNIGLNFKNYTVIYSTPENFAIIRGNIKWAIDSNEICLIAIDEAHCISKSSADHRPAYAVVRSVKETFPSVPVVALTSTATKETTANICSLLTLQNPLMLKLPLDRPNIHYTCIPQSNCFISDVKRYLLDLPTGSGVIVYCFRKLETSNYSEILTREGFVSKPYHSGLVEEIRKETLKDFMSGRLNFLVTTNAFGMGVDRPDVRVVIHYGLPKSPETYYMESGRAGRDGKPAKSVIFWSNKDVNFHKFCFKQNFDKCYPKGVNQSYSNCQARLDKMENYTIVTKCRRATILNYLEEVIPSVTTESCCENCLKTLHEIVGKSKMYKEINSDDKLDITDDTRLVLKLINSYQGKCKQEMLVDFITGTMPTEFDPNHPVEYFSCGINKSKSWWYNILKIVKERKFIDRYTVVRNTENIIALWGGITRDDYIHTNPKGVKFMRFKSQKLTCEPRDDFLQSMTKTDTEYYIVDGVLESKPRVKVSNVINKADDTRAFDFSAFSSHLNKSSPRKRASESDISDVSLADEASSPGSLERSPKLQKIGELRMAANCSDYQPSCSHWNKSNNNVGEEVMQINGDKEQNEGQKYEELKNVDNNNLNDIGLKTSKIVVPLIRMIEGHDEFDPTSLSSSDNSHAKSD